MEAPDDGVDASSDMPTRLLADDEAWSRAGEELKKCDPQRYLAILKVVEDICRIHRDPIKATRECTGFFIFSKDSGDDLD